MSASYFQDFTRKVELSAGSTALLVIDLQNASASRSGALGKMLAKMGREDEAAYRFDRIEKMIVPRVSKLITTFRKTNSPVIFIKVGAALPDFSDAPWHMKAVFEATDNRSGTRSHDLLDELEPLPNEIVLRKSTMGAFASTGLHSVLQAMNISTCVSVGVSTNNCVDQTAREAADRGFGSVIVSDATGTCSEEMQRVTLQTFERLWGQVMDTDEIIAALLFENGQMGSAK